MQLPGFLSRHRKFIGHVATMMSGKTVAAAIALFTTPIVARLFEPSAFGIAAMFVSIVSMTTNIASLRYEVAFSLPKEEQEARLLVALAYRIMFAVCTTMLVVVAAFKIAGTDLSAFELLGVWAWLLPLGVLLAGSLQIQECWLTRRKKFKLSSVSLVLGNAVTSGSRITFGALAGSSVFGLIVGWFLGTMSRLIVQRTATRDAFRDMSGPVDWPSLRQTARKYVDFPKLNAPAGFIFSLGGNLPVLLFGIMFSPAIAGLFAMANRLAHVPVTIVASSVRRVFLQKAASIRNREGSLRKAFVLTTGSLALLGVVPLVILTLFGQPLLGWLLGERWLEAGRFLEIIAPWMFMIWVTAPSNPVFVVLRQQKFWLLLQSSLTLLRLAAFGLGYMMAASAAWTLQAFVVATVAGNLVTITLAFIFTSRDRGGDRAPDSGDLPEEQTEGRPAG